MLFGVRHDPCQIEVALQQRRVQLMHFLPYNKGRTICSVLHVMPLQGQLDITPFHERTRIPVSTVILP